MSGEILLINMEKICEMLQSKERLIKLGALKELQQYGANIDVPLKEIFSSFDECYLHLLKCYCDPYESVRERAADTVNQFMERLPNNDFFLLNVVSTLADRLGQQETLEKSEEIRMIYVEQLHKLVRQYGIVGNDSSLQECFPHIVKILVKALRDPYPAVQREACASVVSLESCVDTYVLQQWAQQLAGPLYEVLNHKHSLARIAAIKALGRIALHINGEEGLPRLLMRVSPLLMDSMALVRRECGDLGILMLLKLKDRYSFFDRIIPLVLCSLKDDSPEVIDYIRPLWVQCGKQYFDENETELSAQEMSDIQPPNYPSGVQRPTIGCRGLVQRSLRLLKLITRESTDWKEDVRLHSLKLLYQFVLHAEAAITAKFFEMYPEVARACRDTDQIVAKEAVKVADLMGRLLSYNDWREHGFEGLVKYPNEGYLKCFFYMFTATTGDNLEDVLKVSDILIRPEFSQGLKPEFQMYVIRLVETLVYKCQTMTQNQDLIESSMEKLKLHSGTSAELDKNMYIITIKVMALAMVTEDANMEELHKKGNCILEKIAERQQTTVAEVHERFAACALDYVDNIEVPLDAFSEPILLFHGLICLCKFRSSYLRLLQTKLKQVWTNCADDAKMKIFTAVSIAMLEWSLTIDKDVSSSTDLLQEFVMAVVEPHLQWRAGANAEAMRSLATATLCAMSQGAPEEAKQVLPPLAKYIPSLLEDHSAATRHYAVKCMFYFGFGELNVEELKPIAYGTLQRLDDPSSGIRELAAAAISKLCPKFGNIEGEKIAHEHEIWEAFIKRALDMLFLHYGGPEVRLKEAIKGSILQLVERYPEITKDSFERTLAMSYGGMSLRDLKKELPFNV